MAKKPKTPYEKIRKPLPPNTIWHKDDSDYHRGTKHRNRDVTRSFTNLEEAENDEDGLFED